MIEPERLWRVKSSKFEIVIQTDPPLPGPKPESERDSERAGFRASRSGGTDHRVVLGKPNSVAEIRPKIEPHQFVQY